MPLYETLDHRRRQLLLIDRYAYANGLTFLMTPEEQHLPWDAEFFKAERLVSLAEVKCRNCRRWQYRTYKVDKAKVDGMLAEGQRRGVPSGMLVEFTDGPVKLGVSHSWLRAHATVDWFLRGDRAGETPDRAYEWSNRLWKPLY